MYAPTDLCCSGWFWQWWRCVGGSWPSCYPLWRFPPPPLVSSLSLWHAHSCGSAYGSSQAWAGPGHPPPATPSRWKLTHTLPRSAHSPPPRSPVEVGEDTHGCRHNIQRKKTHVAIEKIKVKNRYVHEYTSRVQDKWEQTIYYRT